MAQQPQRQQAARVELNGGAASIDAGRFGEGVQYGNVQGVAAEGQDQKDFLTRFMTQFAEAAGGGRQFIPTKNMHEQRGMNGLQDPTAVGQGTNLPLPFDKTFDKTANLLGIVNNLGMQKHGQNEQIVNAIMTHRPEMTQAIKKDHSIYRDYRQQGYYENRLSIALQRRRETSFYAFI